MTFPKNDGHMEAASRPRRGVYILGNDHVGDYLEALFASLRKHSPYLPARLIPYNSKLDRTREICRRYNIEIHTDDSFPMLEAIGRGLWAESPYSNHHLLFRRLAIFWGPFESFLYLDADIVVLAPLEPLFDVFEHCGSDFACFDVDHERVYKAGPLREKMITQHGSIGFNSGHFISRTGVLDLNTFQHAYSLAKPCSHEFQDQGDQGFLNFAVDQLAVSKICLPTIMNDLAEKQWCEQPIRFDGSIWRINKAGTSQHQKKLFLIHWSGYPLPGWHLPNRELYYSARRLGMSEEQLQALKRKDLKTYLLKPWYRAMDWILLLPRRAWRRLNK